MINFNYSCPNCDSRNLKFGKQINIKTVKQFMYYSRCLNCGTKQFLKRTGELYNMLKDQPWEFSKATRKRINKGQVQRFA